MLRRKLPTALALATLFALAATLGVVAKGEGIVTLDAPLPTDPEPGSEITIGWTVDIPVEDGMTAPFNAEGMFIRLIPAIGDPVEAIGRQGPLGHYVATLTVPSDGISDVEAGLRGESCTGGTCQRSDILFPIVETSAPAAEPGSAAGANGQGAAPDIVVDPASPPSPATTPASTAVDLSSLGIAGVIVALSALVVAAFYVRVRGRALTAGSSRS
jgi:hypothetical protein